MRMKDHYLHYYQVLGVQPGCSFRDLKYAYRRLVKHWHPDHFTNSHESGDLAHAEARIKEINKAFRGLSDYYKKHGCLPVSEEDGAKQDAGEVPLWPDLTQASERQRQRPKKISDFSVALRFTVIGAALGLAFAIWNSRQQEQEMAPDLYSTATNPVQTEQAQAGIPKPALQEEYFTVGSTLGDVITVQGVPTLIGDGVWHYGQSKVYFVKGVVLKWDQDPASPLKARIIQASHEITARSFSVGSTKQEVRITQGAPLWESENMWVYRISRIYFKDGKVTGWYDSPLDPLKIHK